MKKLFFTIPLIATLLLTSCGKSKIADSTQEFPENCWLRFEPAVFTTSPAKTDRTYNVCLSITFDTTKLGYSTLPLLVNFYADSNEMHTFIPDMRLRDKNGQLRGTTITKFCTVTDTIDKLRTYNHAVPYTYRIKQRTSKYELYGVTSINLTIAEN